MIETWKLGRAFSWFDADELRNCKRETFFHLVRFFFTHSLYISWRMKWWSNLTSKCLIVEFFLNIFISCKSCWYNTWTNNLLMVYGEYAYLFYVKCLLVKYYKLYIVLKYICRWSLDKFTLHIFIIKKSQDCDKPR
jgi:hypothetical protein